MSTKPLKGKLNDGVMPVRERLTLGEEWTEWATAILPADCSMVQRVESKRAFYAGAFTLLRLTMGNLDPDHEPTELDLQYMDNIHTELTSFMQAIGSDQELTTAAAEALRR